MNGMFSVKTWFNIFCCVSVVASITVALSIKETNYLVATVGMTLLILSAIGCVITKRKM